MNTENGNPALTLHTIYVLTPVFERIASEEQRHWVMQDCSWVLPGHDLLFKEVIDAPVVLNGEPREVLARIVMIDQTAVLSARHLICLGFDINYSFGDYALSQLSE